MSTELTISIVNYNDGNNISGLLGSVFSSKANIPYEVLVIDNGSTDGSAEGVEKLFPQVQVIRNNRNLGFSKAQNIGMKNSSGRYFLMLNPDMTIMPDAIQKLVDFMAAHPDAGVAGGKIYNTDDSIQLSGKKFPSPAAAVFLSLGLQNIWPNNPISKEYYLDPKEYDKTREVEHVMGSFLIANREAINKAGMMDENFFLYCDDVDWCMRIKNAGFRIFYYPEAVATHQKGGTTKKMSFKGTIEHHRSLWYFYKKWYGQKYPAPVNFLFYMGITLRKWIYLTINFFSREKKVRY